MGFGVGHPGGTIWNIREQYEKKGVRKMMKATDEFLEKMKIHITKGKKGKPLFPDDWISGRLQIKFSKMRIRYRKVNGKRVQERDIEATWELTDDKGTVMMFMEPRTVSANDTLMIHNIEVRMRVNFEIT